MKFPSPVKLQVLAQIVDGSIEGNAEMAVTGINEIHMVSHGDITFVDHPKYYQKALSSDASVVIINNNIDNHNGKALLLCDDPFLAYSELVRYFRPAEPASAPISATAVIGEGTLIQPGVFIGNHVTIGRNCTIYANVAIHDFTQIGDNVIIHSNSVLGADAYYFQHKPEGYRKMLSCGRVIIENDVEIGALCAIDRGVSGDTVIGRGTKFDNHVQVGHDTYVGKNCLIGSHSAIAGVTTIEDDVIIWARVAVNKDLVIGKGAVVLATSAVDKSLPGGKTYFGIPAEEARRKWRELAALKQLPDLIKNFRKANE